MMALLEVCVDNIKSAQIAIQAGADRLELCSNLSCGGLTPSFGLYKSVKKISNGIPIYVLIRPRAGDFNYDESEIQVMAEDIKHFKTLNADGLVFGVLKKNNYNKDKIDKKACQHLLSFCKDTPTTFHRAFDVCYKPIKSLEALISLGFSRILTSGFSESAFIGRYNLRALVQKAGKQIIIMPGCGITKNNLKAILEETGAAEVHASASEVVTSRNSASTEIVKGSFEYTLTSHLIVQKMKEILKEST